MSLTKPSCFGDDTQFSETNRICRGCGFRRECQSTIERSANRPAYYQQYKSASPLAGRTPRTSGKIAPVVAGKVLRDSSYNFNKKLMPQFLTYFGIGAAEAGAEEFLTLLAALREHINQINMEDDE